MSFKVGEKVIYPNQGIGVIEKVCEESIGGLPQEFYRLKLEASNSTVMIPVANANHVGLRRLCDVSQMDQLFQVLCNETEEPDPDWKSRYKENLEKMKSGSIFEVAKVLRNLHFLSHNKSLSFREKRMLDRARQLVISEIAMVRKLPLDKTEELVEEALDAAYRRIQVDTA